MTEKYDYMFKWIKQATKPERHIDEVEEFAKKHPVLFMKYHNLFKPIVSLDETDEKYIEAKEKLIKLFSENEDKFRPVLGAVKEKFAGKYF
ncbi:hypothetical protein J0J70_12675 [Turicibacter bilis]|uniref:Uncharacterized protein n=1 Tax=Turicibacter bilis TaxID=2735723 RepID=A0A9Q9CPP5_9FIRM|nr:hypothetical protein [Turicibacter bilis]MDO5794716.1 hypothetical protein [Turicibacter sp.]MBS3196882.1 hypothetical protein [Turicibacter bilis]MBS3201637.1 hypothetical protein [Turicibacter bilis]UUF07180.1 hypothetical protein J0J69_06760 [Turicibacter bilis]UUF08402.1 hypothetical protein J0J70_12675 [Turicibacter bilis]